MKSLAPSLLLALTQGVVGEWTVGQEVATSSGPVVGQKSARYPEVSEYLGIRFGESTEGNNRFLKPKPYKGTAKITATKFAISLSASEDCLFVNVWTKPQTGEKKKAVLFWIYGGAFIMGDSSFPGTNGASLANSQDIIVVSINYRVGLFGFPSSPVVPDKNPGLLDIRLGIEWVRDNIEKFGGDPQRITIFGESAGALAVDYYAYANVKDPIVNGFISSTGNAIIGLPSPPKATGKAWFDLSRSLGCGGEEAAAKALECIQGKPMRLVQGAAGMGMGFNPIVDNVTLFSDDDYRAKAKAGDFIKKPMIVGANQKSQVGMICSARDSAIARTNAGVAAWRFQFSNAKAGTNGGARNGAEIPYIFGDGTGLSGMFQKPWAEFTKDPEHGLEKLGWPTYQTKGKTLVRMAHDQKPVVDFVDPMVYDGVCANWKRGPNAG